jgi:hypothetical protein
MAEEIVPSAARRRFTLEEQAELVRKLADRCLVGGGACAAETWFRVDGEEAEILVTAAVTLEALIPVKEAVRRVVWNDQKKAGRR